MKQNKDKEALFSHSFLLEKLEYIPDTGEFWWRTKSLRKAGTLHKKGYISIGIQLEGKIYHFLAHRLAWFYMTAIWPPCQIDHIDQNRLNNKWDNLRLSTAKLNANNRKIRCDNKTGTIGVTYLAGRHKPWVAQYQQKYLGYFETEAEAISARHLAEQIGIQQYLMLKSSRRSDNKTGVTGVTFATTNGKYRARYRNRPLGTFNSIEEATIAYEIAKQEQNQ